MAYDEPMPDDPDPEQTSSDASDEDWFAANAPANATDASAVDALSEKYGFEVDDDIARAYAEGRATLADVEASQQRRAGNVTDGGDGDGIGTRRGVQPFGEQYSTLGRPSWLQGPYVPKTWNETFTAPTMEQVRADPGYQLELDEGMLGRQRSAAAHGTILNPGTQKELTRFGTDYANSKYGDLYNRYLQQYQQRYGEFNDAATRDMQARGLNEGAYQTDVGNNLNQYDRRYQSYLDLITNNRNASNDYWGRQMDLAHNALTAQSYLRPANPT